MLRHLYIKNFALIDELDIDFHPGFSVITGETGAGKSIILGAIGLLMGNRADVKQIKVGEGKCVVEAQFDFSGNELETFFTENDIDYEETGCILRREVNANGKSRAFINDTPASLAQMKELGEYLIDIHSQHQNLLLQKEDFLLSVVDILAKNNAEKAAYQEAYAKQRKLKGQLDELKQKIETARKDEDYLRFLFQELDAASLSEGNQQALEQESDTLSHAEEIKSMLYMADNYLAGEDSGIVGRLKEIANGLHAIEGVFPMAKNLASRIDSVYIETKDISADINDGVENVDFDPNRLQQINDELDTIYSLQRKHHVETEHELIELREKLREQLNNLDNGGEEISELEKDYQNAYNHCMELAETLTATRQRSAKLVETELCNRLVPLGIPNVKIEINIEDKPVGNDGKDKVQFLFSANKNSTPQPISQVASGGEIARVMLSLKSLISGAVHLPTIIFDEIDTGVSGRVAEKMAQIMREMGEHDRQVISITHLPQIAAQGMSHYKVSKSDIGNATISKMEQLSNEQRIHEIAQMLSGSDITAAALENAKSLLGI